MSTILFSIKVWDNTHIHIVPSPPSSIGKAQYNDIVEHCMQLKERVWRRGDDGRGGYCAPLTIETLNHIRSRFKEGEDYKIDSEASLMALKFDLNTMVDKSRANKRWKFIFEGEQTDFDYPTYAERRPMPHQRIAVEAMIDREYFALLQEMGTGKTQEIIDELAIYDRRGESQRILIVCPKSLRRNWRTELCVCIPWFQQCDIRLLNCAADVPSLLQSRSRFKVGICSYGFAAGYTDILCLYNPTYAAFDESQQAKSPDSDRGKAARQISAFCEKRRILTGTPVSNNILDLWAQCEILRPGALGYQTFAGFKKAFAKVKSIIDPVTKQPTAFDKIVGYKEVDTLKERLSQIAFIVRKDQCMQLPEVTHNTKYIEMPTQLREIYDQYEYNFSIELDGGVASTEFIIVQMLTLSKICCGHITLKKEDLEGKFRKNVQALDGGMAKMDAMIADAIELSKETKGIIWARFHFDIDEISRRLTKEGIQHVVFDGRVSEEDRDGHVCRFNNDPECRFFVGQAQSGGVGLTLLGDQKSRLNSCTAAYCYSQDFNYGSRDQADARNHRKGQQYPVAYTDYVYADTIEESIREAILSKKNVALMVKDVSSIRNFLTREEYDDNQAG